MVFCWSKQKLCRWLLWGCVLTMTAASIGPICTKCSAPWMIFSTENDCFLTQEVQFFMPTWVAPFWKVLATTDLILRYKHVSPGPGLTTESWFRLYGRFENKAFYLNKRLLNFLFLLWFSSTILKENTSGRISPIARKCYLKLYAFLCIFVMFCFCYLISWLSKKKMTY